jgi:hypothetical protein
MTLNFPAIDPAAQIRRYRSNYVNINSLAKTTTMPASMSLMAPSQQAIMKLDLPPALREEMAEFQKNKASGRTVTVVKYMKITNGVPDIVMEDDSPLPAEQDLVTFSHTVSALSLNFAKVVVHQVVATLAASPGGGVL